MAIRLEGYERRHVAFIDILGFSNMITSIEKNPIKFKDLYNRIKSALEFMDDESTEAHYQADLPTYAENNGEVIEKELGAPKLLYVSDCAVISTEATFGGFKALCNKITKVAVDLAWDGLFIRGAITTGNLYHNVNILFGTSYMRVYEFEGAANYPRVIIDPETINSLGGYTAEFPLNPSAIEQSKDGCYYMRYFPRQYFPPYCPSWSDYLLKVKDHIERNLKELDRTPLFAKYDWLKNEFNFAITNYREFIDPVVDVI